MGSCSGIRADGGRCKAQAITGSEYCFNHHPDYEQQRRQRASRGGKRGGRGRPQAELTDIKERLRAMVEDVRTGAMDRADANVCGQLYNTLIRAVSVEVKVREMLEFEARLEALERASEGQGRGERSWGA